MSKVFSIVNRKKFVGVISLNRINLESKKAEIDYWISVEHHGKGYATSAIAQVISYAKESLNIATLYSGCLARNKASIAAHRKNGFKVGETYQLTKGKFSGEEYVISKIEIA